jgi:hypothetical protein
MAKEPEEPAKAEEGEGEDATPGQHVKKEEGER